MTTKQALLAGPLELLEAVYRDTPARPAPAACFRGRVLHRVDAAFARSAIGDAIVAPFERLTFGVDFVRSCWFFVHPSLRTGRFRVELGRSRWRDTETLRLRYDRSRLPIRGLLYDEVKPLDDELCLGLGGVQLGPGRGDVFWFLLEALPGG